MKIRNSFIAALGLCGVACDDTTDTIGIFTDSDNINASTSVYEASTRSIVADSVLSNSNSSYLGRMTDPETHQQINAEFLAQFSTLEDYEFPDYDLMVKNGQGEIEADSIEIRLYYEKYYGDDNNPMKMEVYELDTTHPTRRTYASCSPRNTERSSSGNTTRTRTSSRTHTTSYATCVRDSISGRLTETAPCSR